jgi:DNA-binding response OmpR family regulator
MAWVRAALRRASSLLIDQVGRIAQFGNVEVNIEKRLVTVVTVEGEEVHLAPNEYRLLQALLTRQKGADPKTTTE